MVDANVYEAASAMLLEGKIPQVLESNRQDWENLMGFLASISNSLDDQAKDRLIVMMESVYMQANHLLKNRKS
jgi:hypothetical protein